MHPFSLTQEKTQHVSGGVLLSVGEPVLTTMAMGEEGGLPIEITW